MERSLQDPLPRTGRRRRKVRKVRNLRGSASRQYCMPISQQPFNRSLPNFQQLLLMSNGGKVENSVHLHIGTVCPRYNAVVRVHDVIARYK